GGPARARGVLAHGRQGRDVVYKQTIEPPRSKNTPRRHPPTPATVDKWNLDASFAFYKARFADAGNFTFVFVGSFNLEMIRPLVETYLASLPATEAHQTWRDVGIEPPAGIVEKTVEKAIAPKSEVAIVFSGPFADDDAHRLALQATTNVLEARLFDVIRQELGATYSITADSRTQHFPRPRYTIRIDWTCAPDQVDALIRRVFDEIAFVKTTPLSAGQVKRVRDIMSRDFERNIDDNGYLLDQIARRYENGEAETVSAIFHRPERIATLSADSIHEAAQTYLNMNRYVKVVLMPEAK